MAECGVRRFEETRQTSMEPLTRSLERVGWSPGRWGASRIVCPVKDENIGNARHSLFIVYKPFMLLPKTRGDVSFSPRNMGYCSYPGLCTADLLLK